MTPVRRKYECHDLENDIWTLMRVRGYRPTRKAISEYNELGSPLGRAVLKNYGPMFDCMVLYPEDYIGILEMLCERLAAGKELFLYAHDRKCSGVISKCDCLIG